MRELDPMWALPTPQTILTDGLSYMVSNCKFLPSAFGSGAIKEFKNSVEHDKVVTTLNIIKH